MSGEKLSVCHIASGDLWAGAEAQIATLLRSLAARNEIDLCALLLNPGRLAEEVKSLGIEVKVIPESQTGFFGIYSQAARFLRNRGVRILHSHRYKENVLAAMLAQRYRIPIVVRTQHGLPEPVKGIGHFKQRCLQSLDRFVARRATDCIISVSTELSSHLARQIGAQKIVVIPNGVNRSVVQSQLSVGEAKARLGMPRDCCVIGTAGRLEPIKRLDIFLKAARQIAGEKPGVFFVIAGEGREEAKLRDLSQSLGLADRVLFLGHRQDVYDVLRAMDVLVLCSDHEGLPMVMLEALCLGVVVVAREVGGLPEVIKNGVNGILVKSGEPDALARGCMEVLLDESARKRLAEAGACLVAENYSAEMVGARVAQIYASLARAR